MKNEQMRTNNNKNNNICKYGQSSCLELGVGIHIFNKVGGRFTRLQSVAIRMVEAWIFGGGERMV